MGIIYEDVLTEAGTKNTILCLSLPEPVCLSPVTSDSDCSIFDLEIIMLCKIEF